MTRIRDDVTRGALDGDALAELLASSRRRRVVDYLARTDDERVGVDELVTAVAAAERSGPAGADYSSANHCHLVEVTLHHNHLPKLADAGVIDYDLDASAVRYRPQPALETAVAVLEQASD
ncbi:MAG: hypothetical protein ABEJ31_06770 [Haloarculaceae archaeon]